MKQSTITLKEAINLVPKYSEHVIVEHIPNNFKELTYYQKHKLVGQYNSYYILSVKDEKLFFGKAIKTITQVGKNFFLKTTWDGTIVIKNNSVKANTMSLGTLNYFFNCFGIFVFNDFEPRFFTFLSKSYVIKDVLCKKVYSQETLCKCVLTKGYKIKNFNWKLFRDYILTHNDYGIPYYSFSIESLKAFTKDVKDSIRSILAYSKNLSKLQLLKDLLDNAITLGECVDFTWSDKRIHQEHQRQIEILSGLELGVKAEVPIYNNIIDESTPDYKIHQLNTEKEIFKEGSTMHHCLYTNYYNKIKDKRMIAFHMSFPQECTFTLYMDPHREEVFLDQAKLIRNGLPDVNTFNIIDCFMLKHHQELVEMFSQFNKDTKLTNEEDLLFM